MCRGGGLDCERYGEVDYQCVWYWMNLLRWVYHN
jgi:hypothetical protein